MFSGIISYVCSGGFGAQQWAGQALLYEQEADEAAQCEEQDRIH